MSRETTPPEMVERLSDLDFADYSEAEIMNTPECTYTDRRFMCFIQRLDANTKAGCWAGQAAFAAEFRCSPNAAMQRLKRLQRRGLIVVFGRTAWGNVFRRVKLSDAAHAMYSDPAPGSPQPTPQVRATHPLGQPDPHTQIDSDSLKYGQGTPIPTPISRSEIGAPRNTFFVSGVEVDEKVKVPSRPKQAGRTPATWRPHQGVRWETPFQPVADDTVPAECALIENDVGDPGHDVEVDDVG